MIIVKLIGGLGNQFFQYSLARHLAIKNNCQFKLDISGFKTYKLHEYTLGKFNIIENIVGPLEKYWLTNPFGKIINSILPNQRQTNLKEKDLAFDPNVLKTGANAYLEGYWQSEKYFKEIRDIIKKEFTLKDPLGEESKRIMDQITHSNSVSLHIRRGDYEKNVRTQKIHGLCPLDYYYKSLDLILNKLTDIKIYIFSDDITWAKNNLKIKHTGTCFVSDGNKKIKNYEELTLMSLCKHNIIANSTFSWWGAWLNNNTDKIVVAPQKWFLDETKNTEDLIPETWLKI